MLSIKEGLMSEQGEQEPSLQHREGGRRGDDESESGGTTQDAFSKATRGAAKAGEPADIPGTSSGDRSGDGSDSGGNTPPAGDPPSRGGD
jgi:hypothetical protein